MALQNSIERFVPPKRSLLKEEKPTKSLDATAIVVLFGSLKHPRSSYIGKYLQNRNTRIMGTSMRYRRQSLSIVRPTWSQ